MLLYDSAVSELKKDIKLGKDVHVTSVIVQETIWPDVRELRMYCSDGLAYTSIWNHGEKLTAFKELPKSQEGK